MSIVNLKEILEPAFAGRYGIPAFNVVNDATLKGCLLAAEARKSPVIIQYSVKTIKYWGTKLVQKTFAEMASKVDVPVCLHLDHCPDISVLNECLDAGWNSVLYDGSGEDFETCLANTIEVVKRAHNMGASVEGEVEAVKGVEDGIGSDDEGDIISLDQAVRFVTETGIDAFAPAIGTAHGTYSGEPVINFERVTEITDAVGIPMVLHGGTGLADSVFKDLIKRGTSKVNISTQLKIDFADSLHEYLKETPREYNPLKLIDASIQGIQKTAEEFIHIFGSENKA